MPELPEVETVMRGMEPAMLGGRIAHVEQRRAGLRWPFPERMVERLEGATVARLRRRSKYILGDLDTGETFLLHLGMSGRITISGDPQGRFVHDHPPLVKHDHVVIDMENGARVAFNDARRFGSLDLMATDAMDQHMLIAHLGPEPLGNAFDEAYLVERLNGRNTPIKSALLDQRIIAGLGNIYVCEALFRAGIHPARKAGQISARRVAALVPIIRDVLGEAIAAGGSSLRDYRQADGELGYFQHTFKVYGREGDPCSDPECDATIRRIVQSGRSSFYCPSCQR